MRALIRGDEVMIEPFSPWVQNNLAFLTGTEIDADGNPIKGDGWTLVEDYVPPEPAKGSEESEPVQSTPVEEKPAETVTIDGKEYTKDELLALLNQTS